MSVTADPLNTALDTVGQLVGADGQSVVDTRHRLAFATGQMLSAADFQAEQEYHRGRLARALASIHGTGTVAGLRVVYVPASATVEEQLQVQPGIAIDRLGRLIELPRTACFRLNQWWNQQRAGDLNDAFHAAPFNGVVGDVFLRFVVCPTGLTPAFASGPFDSLDAVAPSRLRDAYELTFVLRKEATASLPQMLPRNNWPDLSTVTDAGQRRQRLHDAIFNAWPTDTTTLAASPEPHAEYVANQDQSSVFLARVTIPATAGPTAGTPPQRLATQQVQLDNDSRLFIYRERALARIDAL